MHAIKMSSQFDDMNNMEYIIKTHDSESRGQEEEAVRDE